MVHVYEQPSMLIQHYYFSPRELQHAQRNPLVALSRDWRLKVWKATVRASNQLETDYQSFPKRQRITNQPFPHSCQKSGTSAISAPFSVWPRKVT